MAKWLDELPSQDILDAVPGSFDLRPVQLLNLIEAPISFIGSELPTFTADQWIDEQISLMLSELLYGKN